MEPRPKSGGGGVWQLEGRGLSLASAAGWFVISQLLWLIGDRPAADAAPIKGAVQNFGNGIKYIYQTHARIAKR
ncbi:hypothetical protein EYF80_047017 [Liparis tanakae]|uniref:Uncharacterized protein n=1 Tax=Liparis tanakae TaxID=230148 RepID=A0A4Z2FP24_9TELE|nr:hypothetical protein EYF80_047017 [Liparis tanakae]